MKTFYKSILILTVLLNLVFKNAETAFCQAPPWAWAKHAGGDVNDVTWSINTDGAGNVYAAGSYVSYYAFFNSDTLTPPLGFADMFIAKYDPSGNILWLKSAGGNHYDFSTCAVTDAAGNFYVTGEFRGTDITFDTITLVNAFANYIDLFVAKYDNAGNVMWAKKAGRAHTDMPLSIAVDASGNVYDAGYFASDSISFGSITLANTSVNFAGQDLFFVKYDSNGNATWVKSATGYANDNIESITVDASGNIVVTGFSNSAFLAFGTDTLHNPFSNQNNTYAFMVKFDNNGNIIWKKTFIMGFPNNGGKIIKTDAAGNIYLTGSFLDTIATFDAITIHNSSGSIILAKYNSAGVAQWAKAIGDSLYNTSREIALDSQGNIYLGGTFTSNTINFGSTTLVNAGYYDAFIAKFDNNGNSIWAKRIGNDESDEIWSFSLDPAGKIYVGGYFGSDTLTIGTDTLINYGANDMFIAKLDATTGIYEQTSGTPVLNIFPNPSPGYLHITFNTKEKVLHCEIINIMGEKVFQSTIINHQSAINIDVSFLAKGIYMVQMSDEGRRESKKLVIE